MDAYFDSLDLPFTSPRNSKKLTKYAILLNEPKTDGHVRSKEKPCKLATELLPDVLIEVEDLVKILGEVLQAKIMTHAEVDKVPIFKADDIVNNNSPTLVPIMYRIATEHFVQSNMSTFKIIECRNVTKLISDWKPSLPDRLISLGHQVIVVQLETGFVPYTDFAYAILRQLNCDWKVKLPRSFFFPDDVCKVEATPERDLCVVSPSMPDGDLEINKKMGLLNYEVLMMIKSSCESSMKNYLLKRDFRVGKFSDTLDGVAALRQLYRELQDRLRSGEAVELCTNSQKELKKLVKESIGGTEALAAHTWIEYGKRVGLSIPASASSSATSISVASSIVESDDDYEFAEELDDDKSETCKSTFAPSISVGTSSPSSGFDVDDGKDCQKGMTSFSLNNPTYFAKACDDDNNNTNNSSGTTNKKGEEPLLQCEALHNTTSVGETDGAKSEECLGAPSVLGETTEQPKKSYGRSKKSQGKNKQDKGFKLEAYTEFRHSLEKKLNQPRLVVSVEDDEEEGGSERVLEDPEEFPVHEFSADSILKILQLAMSNNNNK